MIWLVLSGYLAALISPSLIRYTHRYGFIILSFFVFILFLYFILLFSASSGSVFYDYSWFASFGLSFSFVLDGLSGLFAILICGIGSLIILYSGSYLRGHSASGRFMLYLLSFMASMLGLVLANDVITLFVFWEATSLTSFLLIGFDMHRAASRRAALQALIVTGGGGLLLLLGLIIVSSFADSYSISEILRFDLSAIDSFYSTLILLLILGGAFTKSAQFPFHFWLANAMEAPTPVSAYLHSATMVKAGVYLLMRFSPLLGDSFLWSLLLGVFGSLTLVFGSILALLASDLKRMLAYSTMASLGLLVLLISIGSSKAALAAILYLVAHSFFKGCLFMLAGCIDHSSGTRDIDVLSGLGRFMPLSALAAGLAALSMGGLPPFVGFVAKEVLYDSLLATSSDSILPFWGLILQTCAIIGNSLMFCIAARFAIIPFYGRLASSPRKPHEADFEMLAGPVILAVIGFIGVIFLADFGEFLLIPAASSITYIPTDVSLHLWGGFNLALALSGLTIALGSLLYFYAVSVRRFLHLLVDAIGLNFDRLFDNFIDILTYCSFWFRTRFQNGNYNFYMSVVLLLLALTLCLPLFIGLFDSSSSYNFDILSVDDWHLTNISFIAIGLLAILGLATIILSKTRLMAIIALGIQGVCVAIIFMLAGAPDLSFTQFMVETLSVVILTLVMTRLSVHVSDHRGKGERWFAFSVSFFCGAGLTFSLLKTLSFDFDDYLSSYFSSLSYLEAHGRNIVNVIIVDFRALDTLGEISVVMGTGISCLVLLRLRKHLIAPGKKG